MDFYKINYSLFRRQKNPLEYLSLIEKKILLFLSAENEQISFIAAILPTFFALKKLKDFRRRSIRPYTFMIYETTLVLLLKKKYLVAQPPHIQHTQGSKYLKKCPKVNLKAFKTIFF